MGARARAVAKVKGSYHHGDLKRTLLDGARAVLREKGQEALSLREVARRSGVSHAAPYHHFHSREALLGAVAAEAFADMDRTMAETQAAAPGDPEAQLVAVGMGYLLYALREPAAFRLMMQPEHLAPRRKNVIEDSTCEGPYGRLMLALTELTGAPTEVDLHLCWAAVHGLAMLALDGALDVRPGALAGHARAVLTRLSADIGARSP